jgi:hypothetical protein
MHSSNSSTRAEPKLRRRADTEFGVVPRERDDDTRKSRHDAARECNRRHRNARRLAAFGVLMPTRPMPHSDRWATGIPAAHAHARWLQEGWIEFSD